MKSMTTKSVYIHTIDGKPARYLDGEQIYYVNTGDRLSDLLVPTLKLIRKQQKASIALRKATGWDDPSDYGYGYLRLTWP